MHEVLVVDVGRPHGGTYMRLAFKAQSQCRATWETIATIKHPPAVAFVKQANYAAGNQQVNNGTPEPARARENEFYQNFWRLTMANGWTPERRAKQSEAIRRWRPWEQSTGPKSREGKARVSGNAYKGGTRSILREVARLLRQIQSD